MREFWIQGAIRRPGSLRRKAKEAGALRDGISLEWLRAEKARLTRKAAGARVLSPEELRTLRQINLALSLRRFGKRR